MSEKNVSVKYSRIVLTAAVIVAVIYLIANNLSVFKNVFLVGFGFGVVILVHEFGHFIVAKFSDIKVEAFSIGFPPTVVGVRRREDGWRVRFLPSLTAKKDDGEEDESSGKMAAASKVGETEYRIGLVPLGGFVKLLGQEDMGTAKTTEDPRSFGNKPAGVRVGVLAAGVLVNALSAVVIFMIAFTIGIRLGAPVIGSVLPNSPAAKAGLKAGDEVLAVDGKQKNLDFSDIKIAAALAGKDAKVSFTVKHSSDKSIETVLVEPERRDGYKMKIFGVSPAAITTVAKVSDSSELREKTGLLPGDKVVSVNGKKIDNHWELADVIGDTLKGHVTLTAERKINSEKTELIKTIVPLELQAVESIAVENEVRLAHIYSIVPRLRITGVKRVSSSVLKSVVRGLGKLFTSDGGQGVSPPRLKKGDIILAIGDVNNPVYTEMREVTEAHEDKQLTVTVLRSLKGGEEKIVDVSVVPERSDSGDKVLIGIELALDAAHPVVAKTIEADADAGRLNIPRGAVITGVSGVEVDDFYDVIEAVGRSNNKPAVINWRLDGKQSGKTTFNAAKSEKTIRLQSRFAEFIPFEPLKRLYRAAGLIDAVKMGGSKTYTLIAQTYATLKSLVTGLVSPDNLMGPVGIITISYRIVAEQPFIYYVYFMGLISSAIAVFNFLPLPPLDGGLVALVLVEKIKGSPLSERSLGIIAYGGWIIIGTLILYVTFNDLVRSFL